ncbi:DNA damage-inducible protein D [Sphingomonas sp. ZT3P38]|uniref:DNA damage-inducible protein D n=1 Tax=Parasphingomonas zepuensis TaxID=3096161 RepID=UPI002FCB14A4
MDSEIAKRHLHTFESIRHLDEDGNEFWLARQLSRVLDYSEYRHFQPVMEKAREACRNSGQAPENHFEDILEMVTIGSGAQRQIADIRLSRYACYLVVQNGDPAKPVIALGQTYFAVQTRRQELQDGDQFQRLSEDDRRLMLRLELAEHNKTLSAAAKQSGIETPLDYAVFQDHGYRGLYGGAGAKDIHQRKGLKKSQKILDHMGSTELAANLFRATQTEEKLRRDGIKGKHKANATHHEVGRAVRQTIKDLGGTMPENLPVPPKSIPQIEREQKKAITGGKRDE